MQAGEMGRFFFFSFQELRAALCVHGLKERKILYFHWMSQPLRALTGPYPRPLPDRKFVSVPDIQKQTCLEHTQPQAHTHTHTQGPVFKGQK